MEIKAKEIMELVEVIEQRDNLELEEGILNDIYCKLLDLMFLAMDIRSELIKQKKKEIDILEDDLNF